MKNVVIVCEDLFGLEVYSIINEINVYNRIHHIDEKSYEIKGFLCDNDKLFSKFNIREPILGSIADWEMPESIYYVMGIKNPISKRKVALQLKERGAKFLSVITPWTLMPSKRIIGEGCVMSNYSFKDKAEFGDFVTMINVMSGAAKVGNYTTIDALTNITNAEIGDKVYIGSHAFLMEHIKVGDESVIFPGSMVYTSIKVGSKVAGIPANKIKYQKINERSFKDEQFRKV